MQSMTDEGGFRMKRRKRHIRRAPSPGRHPPATPSLCGRGHAHLKYFDTILQNGAHATGVSS
jgi:hypothetical protein